MLPEIVSKTKLDFCFSFCKSYHLKMAKAEFSALIIIEEASH